MKLIVPSMEYDEEIQSYRADFLALGSSMDGCGSLRRFPDTKSWLAHCEAMQRPETTPEGLVPSTQLLYLREEDRTVVGMIQVRHWCNEYLEQYGGHIGYSVRPSERRKGYAAAMLRDVLPCCRSLGLRQVLVCCRPDNEGSRRTILKNGGVYRNTVWVPDRKTWLERYEIKL